MRTGHVWVVRVHVHGVRKWSFHKEWMSGFQGYAIKSILYSMRFWFDFCFCFVSFRPGKYRSENDIYKQIYCCRVGFGILLCLTWCVFGSFFFLLFFVGMILTLFSCIILLPMTSSCHAGNYRLTLQYCIFFIILLCCQCVRMCVWHKLDFVLTQPLDWN